MLFKIKLIGVVSINKVLGWILSQATKKACVDPLKLPSDVLYLIFSKLNIQDMGSCCLACKEWKAVIDEYDVIWKPNALRNVLGKSLWQESVHVDVGDEPCYRIDGRPLSWKEVCIMRKSRFLFDQASRLKWVYHLLGVNNKTVEIDFLVPATLNGVPTTIRRVLEVFARARLPTQYAYVNQEWLEKYGDDPIGESYWARCTLTVVDGTRNQQPEVRVQMIHEKGEGLYRLPRVIELTIFISLLHQAGKECGDGETFSQTIDTINIQGYENPVYVGPISQTGSNVGMFDVIPYRHPIDESIGARALRAFI